MSRQTPRWSFVHLMMCSAVFAQYTRLEPLAAPKIIDHSPAYPSGAFVVGHIIDGDPKTEYSSNGAGINTFIEFEFPAPVRIGGFCHRDRKDTATLVASELTFKDAQGQAVARHPVAHVGKPSEASYAWFDPPVTAQRVRWQVTKHGPHTTVGGTEIVFYAAGRDEASPAGTSLTATALPAIRKQGESRIRPLRVEIDYPYAKAIRAILKIEGAEPMPVDLQFGSKSIEVSLPAVQEDKSHRLTLEWEGKPLLEREVRMAPLPPFTMYLLCHSHVDIGYTELQSDVERKQMANLDKGIELARRTADYPEGARYKWNAEVLWAVDSYLRLSPPEKRAAFIDAVRKGWVALDAMYGNELTGLCRPEELIRLFSYAMKLSDETGVPIESAMISDVPGYTWGVLTAMAQAGVKYWSIGPNYFDRMGYTIATWENRPFWWVSPSGQQKVLCWVPYQGYAISHLQQSNMTDQFMLGLMQHLQKTGYPYDIAHLRWSGLGDNAVPDEKIPDFVKSWNERYESPKLVIATTTEALSAFAKSWGDKLPRHQGDWTPYWEDGAGSSARETAINRDSAEKLVQAEALYVMLAPASYPAGDFQQAWRNVLLYSEHTWGAYNSITEPEKDFVKQQWQIKQAFALDAQKQAARLLSKVLDDRGSSATGNAIDVLNTCSWMRSDLVTVSAELSKAGDHVQTADGEAVPSQRLSTGELVFMAEQVPALAGRRYTIGSGTAAPAAAPASAKDATLDNGLVRATVDAKTGAIVELRARGIDRNLIDDKMVAANEYLYVLGSDVANPQRSGSVRIRVKESGPLVASLLIESNVPGCHSLTREVRIIAGLDRVEISNTLDKKRITIDGPQADWTTARERNKEAVHFGFAFNVPDGVMRLDIPWAMMRPEQDQIPGACKNWFTVQRFVDVSNRDYGVTWATMDAPLIEVGGLTANLLGSQPKADVWMAHVEPRQTFYSWAMNNHWHTNYRAYQDGPTTFRYALQPHAAFSPDAASRFGAGYSQPLIAAAAKGPAPGEPLLKVEPAGMIAASIKPSDDGQAIIVRLFGASGQPGKATLTWRADRNPKSVHLSNTSEKALEPISGAIEVPAWEVVTVRAELDRNP